MSDNKVNSTFRLNKQVKMDFKIECVQAGVEMSEAVESLMTSFVITSRKIRLGNQKVD